MRLRIILIATRLERLLITLEVALRARARLWPRRILPLTRRICVRRFRRWLNVRTASSKSSERYCFNLSITSLAADFKRDGRPDLNLARSPAFAAARIFDADIPLTPSSSGSRSPADTTSISSNLYSEPLYLFASALMFGRRSEPTTIMTLSYLSSSILSKPIKPAGYILFGVSCTIPGNAILASFSLSE